MIRSCRTEGVTYICRGPGALLSLPCGGYREDAVHRSMFGERIRDNVDRWFNWSRNVDLPVDRTDDLILVTGCTLVTSYALAVFDDHDEGAEISLASQLLNNGGASSVWSNIRGTVEYRDSQLSPVCLPQLHYLPCIDFSRLLLKEYSVRTSESMCLYQGIPSQAYPFLDQTNSGCSRTPS